MVQTSFTRGWIRFASILLRVLASLSAMNMGLRFSFLQTSLSGSGLGPWSAPSMSQGIIASLLLRGRSRGGADSLPAHVFCRIHGWSHLGPALSFLECSSLLVQCIQEMWIRVVSPLVWVFVFRNRPTPSASPTLWA